VSHEFRCQLISEFQQKILESVFDYGIINFNIDTCHLSNKFVQCVDLFGHYLEFVVAFLVVVDPLLDAVQHFTPQDCYLGFTLVVDLS